MKLNIKNIIIGGAMALTLGLTSCVDDLNTTPIDPNVSQEFNEPAIFAKIYASLARTDGDLASLGLDDGKSGFYRVLWELNELPTDEALNAWGDVGIPEMNFARWNSSTQFVQFMYYRLFFNITLCNHYLAQTENGEVSNEMLVKRSEVRFMRALNYFYAMDMFANVPLLTSVVNSNPDPSDRASIFSFLENELLEIEGTMNAPRTGAYGRVDQAAAWTLLARLYLNAEVYTGTARWADAATWAAKVMNESGYQLADNYAELFMADNGQNPRANGEIIFPVLFDGQTTQSYGMAAVILGSRSSGDFADVPAGISGGWDGFRGTPELVRMFEFQDNAHPRADEILDKRGIFYDKNRSVDITTSITGTFTTEGWSVYKYTNLQSNGQPGSNTTFPDTDFPMFRLGDVYLMYAESVARGGQGGSMATAVQYVNALRERAYGDTLHGVTEAWLLEDNCRNILDERCRELYWEGTRRTDLIRYGLFTSADYVWTFKGGVLSGTGVNNRYNVFPIPVTDMSVNGNLKQNEGY